MFKLVKKIARGRGVLSSMVAAATLASFVSLGGAAGVAGAAGIPTFNAPPSAPIHVVATGAASSVVLTWDNPYYTGGNALSFGFNVYMGTTAGGESATPINGLIPINGNTLTVPSLTNGTTYYFTVKAVNLLGISAASAEVSATPLGVPGAPTGVKLTPGNASVAVAWTAPTTTGGSPILGYNVYCAAATIAFSNAECLQDFTSATNPVNTSLVTGTSFTVVGLWNGSPYAFVVAAVNAQGEGAQGAAAAPVTPVSLPNVAEGAYVTGWTSTTVDLYVNPPTDYGTSGGYSGGSSNTSTTGGLPILGYDWFVGTSSGGESATPVNGAQTPVPFQAYTATGLNPGTVYYFQAAAVTSAGVGPKGYEIVRETATAAPGAPTGLTAVNVDGAGVVTLHWTAPTSNGGRAIQYYDIYACSYTINTTPCDPQGNWWNSTSGPTPTSYTDNFGAGVSWAFAVRAYNGMGDGPYSSTVDLVIANATPSAPTLTDVTASGNTAAILNWNGSVYDGGSAILGYNVYAGTTPGGESATPLNGTLFPNGTNQPVTGLIQGTTYYFIVKGINAVGAGAASNELAIVAGGTLPGAPTGITFAAGPSAGMLTSSWNAASPGGNSPVTYTVCVGSTAGTSQAPGNPNCFGVGTSTSNDFSPSWLGFIPGQTVYVSVYATNNFGDGAFSTETSYVVPTAPSAPTNVVAKSTGDTYMSGPGTYVGNVQLTWTASAATGAGSAIQSYMITDVTDGCVVGYTTATSFTVTGWQYGQNGIGDINGGNCSGLILGNFGSPATADATTFTVTAVNSVGNSVASSPVVGVAGTYPLRPHDGQFGVKSVSSTSALVTWQTTVNASPRDGGSPILSYKATAYVGDTAWTSCTYTVGDVSAPYYYGCMLTGLPSGSTFHVGLTATNVFGTSYLDTDGFYNMGSWSETGGIAPVLTATSSDPTTVVLDWTDASTFRDNPVTNYRAYMSTSVGVDNITGGPLVPPCNDTPANLSDGNGGFTCTTTVTAATAYSFVVYSNGPISLPSNTVRITAAGQVPAAPTDVAAFEGYPNWQNLGNNAGYNAAFPQITWDGSLGATGYNVYIGTTPGGESTTPVNGAVPLTSTISVNEYFANLYYSTPGVKYYAIVKAVNATGLSAASAEVSFTPPQVPSTPLNLTASAGNNQVTLHWDAPTTLGTLPFLGYYVYAGTSPNGEASYPVNKLPIVGTTYTVTGLTNGVPFYFMVVAANAAGISPAAFGEEVSVTPSATAAQPSALLPAHTVLKLSRYSAHFGHENLVVAHVTVGGGPVNGAIGVLWAGHNVCVVHLKNGAGSCRLGARAVPLGLRTLTAVFQGNSTYARSVSRKSLRIIK